MRISFFTTIGPITIEEEGGSITSLLFSFSETSDYSPLLEKAKKEVEEYIRGERKEFDLPLSPKGTPFQKKVWRELINIQYGEKVSYGEIGERIGSKAYRAIGNACGKNPIPLIIPCHRVTGTNGSLTGYGGGIARKVKLLELEHADMHRFFVPKTGPAL